MTFTPGGCRDLRRYMNDPKTMEIFGKLISGKSNYRVIEERPQPKCPGCKKFLDGTERFCPECGAKIESQ